MPLKPSRETYGVILVLISAIAFSSKSIWIKFLYMHGLGAIEQLSWRMLIAAPVYLGWILYRRNSWSGMPRLDWLLLVSCGILGYYLASYLDFAGLEFVSAGLERLLLFIYPAFVLIMSAFLYKRGMRRKEVIGLLLAYSGLLVIFLKMPLSGSDMMRGSFLILGAALSYAFYLVGMERLLKKYSSLTMASWAMLISTAITLLHFHLDKKALALKFSQKPEVWGLLFTLGLFSTVLPTYTLAAGISRIGSSKAAIVGIVGPVSTILLAWAFLDETLNNNELVGAILVIAGIGSLQIRGDLYKKQKAVV